MKLILKLTPEDISDIFKENFYSGKLRPTTLTWHHFKEPIKIQNLWDEVDYVEFSFEEPFMIKPNLVTLDLKLYETIQE